MTHVVVVQIIAGQTVPYSKNNHQLSGFHDQHYYEVPEHVASGMLRRGWAKLSQPPADVQPHRKEEATVQAGPAKTESAKPEDDDKHKKRK